MTTPIKLLKIDELSNGTERFRSQMAHSGVADFIRGKDGTMACWTMGRKGINFYHYKEPYEIVSTINELIDQVL